MKITMVPILGLGALLSVSCDVQDSCGAAAEHYQTCTGQALPEQCEAKTAESILSSSCEDLKAFETAAKGDGKGDRLAPPNTGLITSSTGGEILETDTCYGHCYYPGIGSFFRFVAAKNDCVYYHQTCNGPYSGYYDSNGYYHRYRDADGYALNCFFSAF
jgi:hypothetical protein